MAPWFCDIFFKKNVEDKKVVQSQVLLCVFFFGF